MSNVPRDIIYLFTLLLLRAAASETRLQSFQIEMEIRGRRSGKKKQKRKKFKIYLLF